MAKWKLLGQNSCADCKYLYLHDVGYSNYTVEDTHVQCARDNNANLPTSMPYNWEWGSDGEDNWPKTNRSRCHLYDQRQEDGFIHLDVDGETRARDYTSDPELIRLIDGE